MTADKKSRISFSDYVQSYRKEVDSSIGFIGRDIDFFLRLKAEKLTQLADKHFPVQENINVLDIGSGIGLMDKLISGRFKNLSGVDVESSVVEKAKQNNPAVNYQYYDGVRLPFPENRFELVFAVNVMHHVPPAGWENFLNEMFRVLKKNGLAVVFEHNPYNPLTRLAVGKCEFDRDAVLLKKSLLKNLFRSAGFKIACSDYIIFFPFKSKIFRILENRIGFIPLGAQYYVSGLA